VLAAAVFSMLKILQCNPEVFRTTLAVDRRFATVLRLALVDLGHRKVQEQIGGFCRSLLTDIERQIIKASYPRDASVQTTEALVALAMNDREYVKLLPSFLVLEAFIKDFLPQAVAERHTAKHRELFGLAKALLAKTPAVAQLLDVIEPTGTLAERLIDTIARREINEGTSRDEDVVLGGLFDILGVLLARVPAALASLQGKDGLVEHLLHHGLFKKERKQQLALQPSGEMPVEATNLPPLCKHVNTRAACLDLLRTLSRPSLPGKLFIAEYLRANVCRETFWRTPRRSDWTVAVSQQERAVSGFVGLENPGCTCYMNSVLQQLFMIPCFRKALLEVDPAAENRQPGSTDPAEDVLYQVKCIFAGLMEGEKQYYNPKKFLAAFKDIDGSPIDPYAQRDVDEFFNMFMDRIEGLIKGTQAEKVMNNLFQGVFANEFIGKDCPHYSEREEPFLAIPLQVKNKSSIQESLSFYVEGEMLEGDNAYDCEACGKRVAALKRACIKRLPNTLFLVLKRLDFDFDTMQRTKINDFCEFPLELDMKPYSQQELARQDLQRSMEEKSRGVDDLNEDELHILKRKVPDDYYKYRLSGVIVHYGTAEQGHYYSFIKDRERELHGDARWFEFNDTVVRDFDAAEIPEECYGGESAHLDDSILELQRANQGSVDPSMAAAMRQMKDKIKNAYVLIYDRLETYDMQKVNHVIDDVATVNMSEKEVERLYAECKLQHGYGPQPTPVLSAHMAARLPPQIPTHIQDVILGKNKKFWLNKTVFSADFVTKIYRIFSDVKLPVDHDYDKYAALDVQATQAHLPEFEAYKFLINFFLTVALRVKDRAPLHDYIRLIREAL
jgi:ubiquitin C-terminal hydrolase